NRLFGKSVAFVSADAMAALCSHDWPGNVRELAHAVESAVLLTDCDRIGMSELPLSIFAEEEDAPANGAHIEAAPNEPAAIAPVEREPERWPFELDEVIKRTLLRSLEETDGNRRRAADLLGVSRSTLYRMLTRYGIAETARRRGGMPILSEA
ncbi:MAG TPA: helix-turn-helix domain-containing protein, partial [Candidatus Binataceae bacterium]|nr:helix-turn-helix domain-containing protein [Candidatus Binataceae bacterium]